MDIVFIASFSLISAPGGKTRELLTRDFGLPLEPAAADPEYVYSEKIGGSKHFGVWPLAQAAQACFGSLQWPEQYAAPQATIEFEVANEMAAADAERELIAKGHRLLHASRKEP